MTTAGELVAFGKAAWSPGSMTDQFFRRTTESPYGERIRKLIGDAQAVEGAGYPKPDLLWIDSNWWLVMPFFATYRGVRFRVEGNRLHLLPNSKVRVNG